MNVNITPAKSLRGVVNVPGDKSVSHRSVMIGALACGETEVKNFLMGEDCLSTIRIIRALGVDVQVENSRVVIRSDGLETLREPGDVLDAGNSGTTMRLMSGILAGSPFYSVITGDDSLRSRPMGRVIRPLVAMGAEIMARNNNLLAPISIKGGNLKSINYESPVASAQVKSAVLLAGLFAPGCTTVTEPTKSRDHTERMLRHFGARVEVDGTKITVWGKPCLTGKKITVPGDISSAMFLIVAGLIVKGSEIVLPNVGINPTRTGALQVLKAMGGDITINNPREVNGEPIGDITVRSSKLKGTEIGGAIIPYLIDEIPVLAVAAALAEGKTVISDAGELRHKESDRIATVVKLLRNFGAGVEEFTDGLVVHGVKKIRGAVCETFGDHRLAMSAAVAGLAADGETVVMGAECVHISYPGFFDTLKKIAVQ
ncbi:3-phosphoshikimate 1-carboxyvinyltransferase [Desulfotruncus alcoholivorax]|uniref:3-phosphoshikimate 1-carboxyvinyltransferase n=1 Tax=Desulfotruncus alcoholivorax TaxID=265477 RepID=UPI0004815DB1|nr:3-phosphoshikimate 1-carboxyvinyltransferase [Desulfotruncus alcoholivorax]